MYKKSKLKLLIGKTVIFFTLLPLLSTAQNNLLKDSIWGYSIYKYACEQPLIDSSHIFLGADGSPICCLDKKTGTQIWKLDVVTSAYKSGFVHGVSSNNKDVIYCNGMSQGLYAIQKNTGKILWTKELKFDDDVVSHITVLNDVIYINPISNEFYAYTSTGELLWKTDLSSNCIGYSVNNNQIFCQLYKSGYCILDRSNGKLIKAITNYGQNRFFVHPPAYFGNDIIIGNAVDSVISMDAQSLKQRWVLNDMQNQYTDGRNLFVYNDSTFKRINPADEKKMWSMVGDFHWYLQPTVFNNKLYLQTRHNFHIIDLRSGKSLYECIFSHKSYTKPFVEKGIIYLGYANHYLAIKDPTEK